MTELLSQMPRSVIVVLGLTVVLAIMRLVGLFLPRGSGARRLLSAITTALSLCVLAYFLYMRSTHSAGW